MPLAGEIEMNRFGLIKLATVSALLAVPALQAEATVLTFDGSICTTGACSNYGRILQSYGDTASVDVQYNRDVHTGTFTTGGASSTLSYWSDGYNSLVNVAWGGASDGAGTPMIFLKPLHGLAVTLNGFDLGSWFHTARGTQVTIVDGAGATLFSSGPITVGTGDRPSHFAFSLSSASGIGIQWGPSGFNTGIDNVDFSAGPGGVPEPATWALMLIGFGAVGLATRRRESCVVA